MTEKEAELQWVKHGVSRFVSMLGKDVIVLGGGSFLAFFEILRADKKEAVYHANSEARGDGVQCFCTHRSLPCFAFCEMCRNPRVFVVSYPSFEIFKTFESVISGNYLALAFSEMEFLVALTGIPDHKIVVWNWRTGERLCSQETELAAPGQDLRVSPTSPVQILQTATKDRRIIFWEANVCYKKILLDKSAVTLPETSQPPYCFVFGADGILYFVDSEGSLYSVNPETRACALQVSCATAETEAEKREGEGEGERERETAENSWKRTFVPVLCWHKGGLVFTTPRGTHFWRRKSPEGWTKIWSFAAEVPFRNFVSSAVKDILVGTNYQNEMMMIKGESQVETTLLKRIGADIDFVCMVHPVGDYVVTLGNALGLLAVWNVATGERVSRLPWTGGRVTALASSPKWPYLVAVTADGHAVAVNVYDHAAPVESDRIHLTTDCLDAIRFCNEGLRLCAANMDVGEFFLLKVQYRIEVVAHLRIDLKIVDFALSDKDLGFALLVVPMSQLCCRSGQTLLVYVPNERTKGFAYLKDVEMPFVSTSIFPSPFSSKELFCVPHRSRKFYVMNINNGKLMDEFVSGHQMKFLTIACRDEHLVTFGADGLLIVRQTETKKCVSLCSNHHRLRQGIKHVVADPYLKYVCTLGHTGSLVCVLLKKLANTDRRPEYEALMESPAYKALLGGDKTVWKAERSEESKVWVEMREHERISEEEQQSRKEKQSILEEFLEIQTQVKELLDKNFADVPERQLSVHAFDLNKAGRRKKMEEGKAEREKEKQLQLASIKNFNKITDVIRKTCWDSVQVKGREIQGVVVPLAVQSYPLFPENKSFNAKLTWLCERMKMEQEFHKGDFFQPWVPRSDSALELHINSKFEESLGVTQTIKTKYEEENPEESKAKVQSEDRKSEHVWTGTSTHNFVDVDPNHHSQFELTTFLQSQQEIQLIEVDVKKLMTWFNREFLETFALKEREMAFVYEKNKRFRHIINELTFFNFSPAICGTQVYDPRWEPQENPETIMTVDDSEITVPMYISESKMELLRKKEMEEQRLRQLMMADDFKEKALLVMMDGVLEKLWEDEIKKDVPRPKCMAEKEEDQWTEDDLRAVRAYEEAVRFLASERERYRKILEADWAKTIVIVKESVSRFDEKLARLHLLKLKVESAICQENLKSLRIRKRCLKRIEMDRKEVLIKSSLMKNEKKMEAMGGELNKLLDMLNECRNFHENLLNKDRNLEKNFKREFPDYSPIICEQLFKLSKKRPKLLQKAATFSTVLLDMGKCVVSGSKPEHMPAECIQYLKDMDALDAYSNAPASVSPQAWELACKMRRQKIDTEMRIRACAIDLADAEATVAGYQRTLKATKEQQAQLQNDLQALRAEKLSDSLNYQIQLVLKKGWVEIPTTGHSSDFSECVLVTKDTLSNINRFIQKMGQQKIKAMQKAANFRKGIIYKEWEHKKLRMEIEDLKNRLETVEKLQVLKELQAILVARARGFTDEKGFLYLENELTGIKKAFEQSEVKLFGKIDELNGKTEKLIAQNRGLDERIAELNVTVNEMNFERDRDFDKKRAEETARRMRRIRERSKLVRTIQQQHNEMLVLQTELELLRLKTYPAIKHKIS